MKEMNRGIKRHPWKTWAPGREDVSLSPPSPPAEEDIPIGKITAAWQKISRESQTPPAYDYSSIPNSDLKNYLENVESKIREVNEWPISTSDVRRQFISTLQLPGYAIINSIGSAIKYKIITPSAEKGRFSRYNYFDPNGVRAFAAFCWPAVGTNFTRNLPPNKVRVTAAKEALGLHPLKNYLYEPTPPPLTKRYPAASKQDRETLPRLTTLTLNDPKLEVHLPKVNDEEIQILNDWTEENLKRLKPTVPSDLNQAHFDNGLPFQVAQTIMLVRAIGNRRENTIRAALSKFDPNLMELTNLDLKTGLDFCLMVMSLHPDKYPTLCQLYEKALVLAAKESKSLKTPSSPQAPGKE